MVDFFRMVKKGEQIGKVTSARYSPRREKSIAYRNAIEHSEVGSELEVKSPLEGTPLRWSPSSS
jgi:glycine cleavage system aminomethyltransferase T